MDPLELRAGVGAELLGEADPDRLVPLQRLGGPAGPLQGHQQAHPQRLPQRMAPGQLAELGRRVELGPIGQVQVDAPLQRRQVALLEPWGLRLLQPVRPHAVERGTVPQAQRVDQPAAPGRRIGRGRGQVQQPDEPQRVHPLRLDLQRVPAAAGGDQLGAEQAPEASHVALHVGAGVHGEVLAPHRGRQPLHRHRLAGASQAPPVTLGGILTATRRTLRDRPSGRSIVATAPARAPISA